MNGHVFAEHASGLWLIDSGAPTSFGKDKHLVLLGEHFAFDNSYHGLGIEGLVKHVGVECVGLIGSDVLFNFDVLFDCPHEKIEFSKEELDLDGMPVPLWEFMGLPLLMAEIAGTDYRKFFFDTGAQVSYFQDEVITTFPKAGVVTDFFPDSDDFETETYNVDMSLGGVQVTLRCGMLPETLAVALTMANAQGIIGNQLLLHRRVGFFPRQGGLVLGEITDGASGASNAGNATQSGAARGS
ncbi:MAG: hypothetical protein JNK53_03325, partial [Phycisphaerae bacterium]|nr:hypothetical protein [Phycisphaerae bacterium]